MKDKKNRTIKLIALIIGTLGMVFSGLNWQIAIFAWIAPICLLFYTRNSRKLGFILFFVLLSFAGYISQTCNNLFDVFIFGLINGLSFGTIFTIIYLIDKLLYTKGKGFYSTLIFPSVYVSFEFLISTIIGTSGIVAQSQLSFNQLAQLSTITGMFGVSFIVVWFASIINWIIENNYSKQSIRKAIFIYGTIFLLIMIFGIIKLNFLLDNNNTVKVASVSGKTDIHVLFEKEQADLSKLIDNPELEIPDRFFANEESFQNQIANTIKAAEEGAKIIVWNEDALILNHEQVDSLLVKTKAISKTYNAYILLAFLEKDNTSAPKPFNNKSLLVTPKGEIAWEYLKSHLAPPEIPIINAGNSIIPYIDTEYGRIGNVICYDLDFPTYLRQAKKNSIDIMLVPAYDWKEYASLHSNMARFEALQSGFSLIRSNGAGINLIADNQGNVIAEMNTFTSKSKILYADLPLGRTTTIYSKIGNVFAYLLLLFLLVIIGFKIAKR
jgi:apolipoprotein N-acyltransferase